MFVFDVSVELYRDITGLAVAAPPWMRTAVQVGTEAGLLVLAALFAVVWWRARGRGGRSMALALLAPGVTVAAYLASETAKTLVEEERPCRAVAGAVALAGCPPTGDWSFPSNHSTIAAASAVSLTLAWRALGPVVLPLAALMALSRVFVGVHYPHDVAAGFLLGTVVAAGLALAAAPRAARLVHRLREHPTTRPVLSVRPERTATG